MSEEKRQHKRYAVSWRGRIALPSKQLHDVKISDISRGGVGILFTHMLPVGSSVSVEFYVKYRGVSERIRAKTSVVFATILADNRGTKLGLQYTAITKEEMHVLSNVLHMLEEDGY